MRQYKFRGKRVDNGEWVFGYVAVHTICGDETELKTVIVQNPDKIYQYESWIVDPQTVGQFTGLHDKNSVDIYDGDIVYIKGEDNKGAIVWDSEELEYGIDMEDVQVKLGCFYGRDLEAIGNIHDKE